MSQSETILYYIGDPMCSWCYGFSNELTETVDQLGDEVKLELIMGGLRPYNKETMKDLKDFLTHHWEDVHAASGEEFSYGILDDANITYDTEPPSRATVVVRHLKPEVELQFFKGVQSLFYKDNKNMHLVESYQDLVESLDLDYEVFKEKFESEEMKILVKDDFIKSGDMGVRGFPAMVLKKDGQFIMVSNGYTKSKKILSRITPHLE